MRVGVRGPQHTSVFFFFQAEDGIRDYKVTGVQTCALPIYCAGCAHRYLLRGKRYRQAPHSEPGDPEPAAVVRRDRKSTRLNSSHLVISYAVFCLKKKKKITENTATRRALSRPNPSRTEASPASIR